MSDQCWSNSRSILEREWLALRWHEQDLLGLGRWTNIEQTVDNNLSRPDEQNDIEPRSFVNVGPTKLPTLVQRMIVIWDVDVSFICC